MIIEKIKTALRTLYQKLVLMDDSPHAIALGFGVGVFLGILPGTGPLAAVGLAFVFKLNKAAALLGSVLTNTWLSVITFVMAVKLGSWICNVSWQDVSAQVKDLIKHFSFHNLFDVSIWQILKPLLIGYALVGVLCGLMAYGLVRLALLFRRRAG